MIIEDPESFKAWLTARLEPLCDADPAALAKYVYALVKKDKPVEELRSSMIGQLEVFLQKETQGFVNLLFRTLETQKYDEPTPVQNQVQAVPAKTSVTTDFEPRETYPAPPVTEEAEKKPIKEPSAAILASAQNSTSLGCALLATATGRKDFDRHGRKCDSDKEDRSRRRGRRGSSASPERRRTRSRSFERRRSRSRDRDRGRAWRNKSPPSRGRYERERRHTHSKSPVRRYSKSRSPPGNRRTRYRNRSPPRSRTRSRSPVSNKYASNDGRDRKETGVGISPRGENSHGDTDLRLPVIPPNIQSVVSLPADQSGYQTRAHRCRDFDEKGYCMRGDLCPFDHGSDPVILEDVDPLYNGNTPAPLMLQTSQPPPPITQPPPSITQVSTTNMAEYNPDAPSMEPRMWTRQGQFRSGPIMRGMARNNVGRGFNHQRELINVVTGTPQFRHNRPTGNQDFKDTNNHVARNTSTDKQNFDFTRLGANRIQTRPPIPQHTGGNTSIQLKKVPPGVNDITLLNNHFSKFGKIINIQVNFEGDPESALITFATHTEANVAYKSTEAVLNNRFIRVFWYNPSNNNENKPKTPTPTPVATKPSVLERLGAPPPKVLHNIQPSAVQHEEKVTVVNNSITKTLYIPSAMKKEIPVAPVTPVVNTIIKENPNEKLKKKIEEVTQAKKKQEEARKIADVTEFLKNFSSERTELIRKLEAGIKLNADLRKRKQELLEKQINHQKILIQRVEAGNIPEQQKKSLMETIKDLQGSIESIRKDLENSVKANITTVSKKSLLTKDQQILFRKTKEEIVQSGEEDSNGEEQSLADQTTKELLDAELDLLQSQHEGKDVTELRKKVIELKKRAAAFGIPAVRGAYRGRGVALRARGRGRGRGTTRFVTTTALSSAFDPHNVVDHRPTKILVSGYEQDDKDEVLKHFEVFGEILEYISDDATPSLVLNYKARKDAEKAILKGRNFHDRLLSVTWATPNTSIRGGIPTKPPTPIHRQVMVLEEEENLEEVIEDADEEDEDIGILSPDILIHDDEDEDEEDRSWRR